MTVLLVLVLFGFLLFLAINGFTKKAISGGQSKSAARKDSAATPPLRPIGHEDPNCPYCGVALKKVPRKLRPCDACGKVIYPRKRPLDGKVVLFREEELDQLEEQRAIAYGTYEFHAAAAKRRQDARDALRKKLGGEPKDKDVTWMLLNEDAITSLNDRHWGGYITTRSSMARLLVEERRFEEALTFWYEVAILETIDLLVLSHISHPADWLTEEAKQDILDLKANRDGGSSINQYTVEAILECCKAREIAPDSTKPYFERAYERTPSRSAFPLDREELWSRISTVLKDAYTDVED